MKGNVVGQCDRNERRWRKKEKESCREGNNDEMKASKQFSDIAFHVKCMKKD